MLQYHTGYSLFHLFWGTAAERLCHLLNFSLSDEKAAVPSSSSGQRLLQKPLHGVYLKSTFIPHSTIMSSSCNWMSKKGLENVKAKIKHFKFDKGIEL